MCPTTDHATSEKHVLKTPNEKQESKVDIHRPVTTAVITSNYFIQEEKWTRGKKRPNATTHDLLQLVTTNKRLAFRNENLKIKV